MRIGMSALIRGKGYAYWGYAFAVVLMESWGSTLVLRRRLYNRVPAHWPPRHVTWWWIYTNKMKSRTDLGVKEVELSFKPINTIVGR
jgi:hypothetical protein